MRTLVVVKYILCYILYMHYVAAIKILQDGAEVDFEISEAAMCYDSEFSLKSILNIPIGQCVVECGTRQRCQGVNYRMNGKFNLCKLLSVVDDSELMAGNCALVRRSDIEVKNLPCDTCAEKQACNVATGICAFEECEFPSIDNGVILGNMNEKGSRLRVKCNPGYTATAGRKTMVCGDDGSWSDLPICETEIDECATDPCQNGGTCIDTPSSYSCTCVAGYTGTDCETETTSELHCLSVVDTPAMDQWCTDSCNHDPPVCPTDMCNCGTPPPA